jgi:hypothetical protein
VANELNEGGKPMNGIGIIFSSRIRIWALALMVVSLTSSSFSQEEANPRLLITDSHSWEISGGFAGSGEGFGGAGRGGARPQTAEIIKTFGERCPRCTVTANKERADYVVILEHEGGKDPFSKDNKFGCLTRRATSLKVVQPESWEMPLKRFAWASRKTGKYLPPRPNKLHKLCLSTENAEGVLLDRLQPARSTLVCQRTRESGAETGLGAFNSSQR